MPATILLTLYLAPWDVNLKTSVQPEDAEKMTKNIISRQKIQRL